MKKFLIILGSTIATLVVLVYLSFLFVLPRAIDLNTYKSMVQEIAKEQANLNIDFENARIVTTPNLQAGAKIDKISVTLPDSSELLTADSFQARLSIPQLFLLTVKLPCVEIVSPKINLEIANGEQFKVVRLVEDILNKQKNQPASAAEQPLPFDPSIIKIKVPNVKVSDYKAIISDLKSGHSLTLKGDLLTAGYNNGKTARVKTQAELLSDDNTNITAKIAINTFIPPAKPADKDDDPAEKIELPFMNPVLLYRDYDLKTNIDTRLKVRQNKEGAVLLKGHLLVDGTTMNLSGLQLPKSYVKAYFNGMNVDLDTNIALAKNQNINVNGKINYSKKPRVNLNIISGRIYFNDMIILSKAFLDTMHIQNNLKHLKGQGFWSANANIKTNFKKIKSKGCIIARNGSVSNDLTHLVFDKINANLFLEGDTLKITDTRMYINNKILGAEGKIDADAFSNIRIHSDKLPLDGLFLAFAPAEVKRTMYLSSGTIAIDTTIQGELTKSLVAASVVLDDLIFGDKKNTFVIKDKHLAAGFVTDLKTLDGTVANSGFSIELPPTKSVIKNPNIEIKINEKNIAFKPFDILINDASKVGISGAITDYIANTNINLIADGTLNAVDLRRFLGRDAEPFVEAKGNMPIKAKVTGTAKRQDVIAQIKADGENYITPIEIDYTKGKQSILQAKFDYKGDRLHIRQTGLYTGAHSFTDDFETNMEFARPVAEVSGTIVNLNTPEPFINLIKVNVPREILGKLTAFKNSEFKANGNLTVFGKMASPLMRGNFKVHSLNIPELMTTMDETNIDLSGKNINVDVKNVILNGSDINVALRTDINPHPVFTISKLDVNSKNIDLDKMMKVTEELTKYMAPPLPNAKPATEIPVEIRTGEIDLKRIKTGNIIATNTTGRISMAKNNFFLNNLRTTAFDGLVRGNIITNLITMALDIKTNGTGLNTDKAMVAAANMKNTLSGNLNFDTDIQLQGLTYEEQMKSLKGDVNFVITDGQLGPFGKLENMILAENIRESQFFQTALGGVLNSLATIDTSHFKVLTGVLSFNDGVVHINPITTVGNVLSVHIGGEFDLLKNTADMKVRAKLGSVIANLLGPLAQLNPINLVQATPGLNVVMAQAFALFCEQISVEEAMALPKLETKLDDDLATKFQIVLRGDVAKPLTLVKSFKWLALPTEMAQAENFVSTLPDPSLIEDPNNATLEAVLQAQEEKAKEDAKLINRAKKFFTKEN